jgi:hypothetical protein
MVCNVESHGEMFHQKRAELRALGLDESIMKGFEFYGSYAIVGGGERMQTEKVLFRMLGIEDKSTELHRVFGKKAIRYPCGFSHC